VGAIALWCIALKLIIGKPTAGESFDLLTAKVRVHKVCECKDDEEDRNGTKYLALSHRRLTTSLYHSERRHLIMPSDLSYSHLHFRWAARLCPRKEGFISVAHIAPSMNRSR